MALQKEIELNNGIVLNYHRIDSINKITNWTNQIVVASYTSEKQREIEKAYQDLQKKSAEIADYNNTLTEEEKISGKEKNLTLEEQEALDKGIDVYTQTDYINLPYDENQSIQDIYDYLKTTEKYKNAKDI